MQKWIPLIEDEPSKIDVLVTVVDENFYYNVELGEVLKAEYTTKKVSNPTLADFLLQFLLYEARGITSQPTSY